MRVLPYLSLSVVVSLLSMPLSTQADELLVGNKSADTVWFLSLEDGKRTRMLDTGVAPHEIAVDAEGRRAVVTNYGADTAGHSLTVLDLTGAEAPRTVDIAPHGRPHGIRFLSESRVIVTTEATADLVVVDLDAGQVVEAIAVGEGTGHMVALSPDGTVAYVSKIGAGTVTRIDLATQAAVEASAGEGAEGIATRPGEVWVSNRAAGTVTVHDPDSLEVLHTLDSPGFPIRVVFTPDDRHALVTNARAGELAVFDTATKQRVATVELLETGGAYRETLLGRAGLPIGVAVDPRRPRAYVAISGGDEIAVVDTARWEVVDRWPTGREPDALGIVPGASH